MDLLLLATEATEAAEGGGSGLSTVVVITLIVALAAFAVAYVVVGPGRKRKAGPERLGDIPLAMRPYHSDEELETTGLERAMAWGVALSLFSAVFVAAYWVIEPARINDKIDEFYMDDGRRRGARCSRPTARPATAPTPGVARPPTRTTPTPRGRPRTCRTSRPATPSRTSSPTSSTS